MSAALLAALLCAAAPTAHCATAADCAARCQAGDLAGCWTLGALAAGSGDEKDAAAHFAKACDGGFAKACASLSPLTRDPARAVALARRACDAKAALGCVLLAVRHRAGDGVPRDAKLALSFARQGCDGGEPVGCIQAAVMLVDQGQADAGVALLDQTCQAGAADACHNLATLLTAGKPVAKDLPRALQALEQACGLGVSDDCELAARLLLAEKPDDPKQAARVRVVLEKACALASGPACYELSVLASARDEKKRWAEKACASASPEGCFKAGLLAEGETRAANDQALAFHERACELKWKLACDSAIALVARGAGTPEKGRFYFEQMSSACDRGVAGACDFTAQVLRSGLPAVPKDVARAAGVLKRACEAGHGLACAELSRMHGKTGELPRDAARAEAFKARACQLDAAACVAAAR